VDGRKTIGLNSSKTKTKANNNSNKRQLKDAERGVVFFREEHTN